MSLLERLEVACSSPALTLCPIYNDSDGSLEVGVSLASQHTLMSERNCLILDGDVFGVENYTSTEMALLSVVVCVCGGRGRVLG